MSTTFSEPFAPAAGLAAGHVAASNVASDEFFQRNADSVAQACHAMAARFQQSGRLLAYGDGAQRSDVSHIVVEFVHPVIVGKRALPALALETPRAIDALGRSADVLMVLCAGGLNAAAEALIGAARAKGMLVLVLTGAAAGVHDVAADFHFSVPSDDPFIVQETHEMLYHVLWELVHVFLEHASRR